MREQLNLTDFANKMDGDRFKKHDFIADTRQMIAVEREGTVALQAGNNIYHINPHAHGQIAGKLSIPKKYYDRILSAYPGLLAENINTFFQSEHERRMIRTLDGTARAYLSDKFRTDMDNYDVANAALPILQEVPDLKLQSLGVTDTRMYIKATFPRLRADVKLNDPVCAGIVISNSEVGAGSLRVEPLIYRLVCLNGMISGTVLKKFHVGVRQGLSDEAYNVLTQETREKSAEAMRSIVRDVVRAATNELDFHTRVKALTDATDQRIEGDVPKAIEVLGNTLNLTQGEQGGILRHLIEGGDLTQYGLANAVTRLSQDVEDYDRATDLERAGGNVITLPKTQWQEVAIAA